MRFIEKLFGALTTHTQAGETSPDHDILDETFRFVAVDVETANAEQSSICQLGMALITDDRVLHTMSFLIDPETRFAAFNTDLHGISARTVHGHAVFPDVIETLRGFLERHPLVQHSGFDKGAMDGACRRYGLPELGAAWHDSVAIARRAWPELRGNGGHGLGNLKGFLGLEFQHHDAGEDARAAALVVLQAERHTGLGFADLAARSRSGARFEKPVAVDGDRSGPLFGEVACFTGSLSMSRAQAATLAAHAGITVKAGVSRKVTLLVVGDQDLSLLTGQAKSSKHRHAEALAADGHAIRILRESDFHILIGN